MSKYKKIEKRLYAKTCDLPYFTVDDIRKRGLMRYFDSPHQFGAFLRTLARDGVISAKCLVPAKHKEAKGRSVTAWVWEVVYEK